MIVAIISLTTFIILFIRSRKKSDNGINLMDRYIHLMLYNKYGPSKKANRFWINPFTKDLSDYETYYFDPKIITKEMLNG